MHCHEWGYTCIDPGNPSNCQLNNCCCFRTREKREAFENLPNAFYYKNGDYIEYYKNRTQLKFLLADLPKHDKGDYGAIAMDGSFISFKPVGWD